MARKTQYNKLTSPEKTAKINPNNMRLKDDFLLYLQSVRRSAGTIAGYDSDLLIVFTYILDYLDNKDFHKLTKRDVIGLQNWMLSNGNSSARIRRVKAALSSLSNYIENILSDDDPEYVGYRSIIRKIENPPLQATMEKTVWKDGELEGLLSQLVEKNKYEQACMVALGMYSGRRKAELCRFKVSDFDDDKLVCDGALYKSSPLLTKGNKYLECYTLAKRFKPYLDLWMQQRSQLGIDSEWLFPDRSDYTKSRDPRSLNSWTEKFSRMTGKDFYMHALRHYFVSALSREGLPDNVIVQIIGWSSSEMFNVYNDNSKDDQIAMFFKDGEISVEHRKDISDL